MKDYIQQGRVLSHAEQVSGGLFLLVDGLMLLSGPDARYKTAAGAVLLTGAGVLGFSGLGEPGQNLELFSSSIVGLQAMALIFEKQFQGFSARMNADGKGLLKTVFNPLVRHLVVATSVMDIIFSNALLAATALLRRDWGLLGSSLLWSATDPLLSDQVLKEGGEGVPVEAAVANTGGEHSLTLR